MSIGIVGEKREFAVYDDEGADEFLNLLDPAERKGRGGIPPAGPDDAPPPDDDMPPPPPEDPSVAGPDMEIE